MVIISSRSEQAALQPDLAPDILSPVVWPQVSHLTFGAWCSLQNENYNIAADISCCYC